jgi:hypothetical protein
MRMAFFPVPFIGSLIKGGIRHPFAWILVAGGLLLPGRQAMGGTWTPLVNLAPGSIGTMLLLTDGTVMAQNGSGVGWCRLTPDMNGSYVNGTWSTMASMNSTRLYYSSDVLRDGRVLVAGGEYGTGTTNSEVYDPVNNTWTVVAVPPGLITMNNQPNVNTGQNSAGFIDSVSKILANGNVLVAPVEPVTYGGTVIFNPTLNTWSAGPTLFRGFYQDEASWVKLPDDSILTVDPFGTSSERYIPSLNQWINDANVPVALYDPYGSELGAAFLLPDGRAFFLGATGNTAFYTPGGGTNMGTWSAGPVIPNSQGTPDAPAAMMVNGHILCAVSPTPTSANHFPSPTSFYEYDPVGNSFTQVNGPAGSTYSSAPYIMRMLDLPDGTVLFVASGNQLYDYQPAGSALAAGKPGITGITTNLDGSYHLTGTLLNGISEGAAYGDDAQMNSNYPLLRMTNSTGNVYYARTFNWSSTGVMTGSTPESTDFTLPAGLPVGTYSLVVVANGISSDPVSFSYIPDALQIAPLAGFTASGGPGGPFGVTSQNFTLTNYGASSLNWSVINAPPWLNISPGGGTLSPGGPAAAATVSLNANASNLVAGTYTASLWFTNLNSHYAQSRLFTLMVQPPQLVQNGGFEAGSFIDWTQSGNTATTFVTSGNSSYVHSGTYGAELGPAGSLGYLSQALATSPGQSYLLSFWLNNASGGTPTQFLVDWGAGAIYSLSNPPAFGWTNLQFIVTAAASSTVLQFGFQNDPNYFGLDDVSVVPVPPAVFQSLTQSNNTIWFSWTAMSGLAYQVQYKTNLFQATWTNLGNPVPATGSTASATDKPGTDAQRFYRLIVLP